MDTGLLLGYAVLDKEGHMYLFIDSAAFAAPLLPPLLT